MIDVYIEVCREGVQIPEYAHKNDAGVDLRSAEDIEILPNTTLIIPTGLKMSIPKGYELEIRPRSGISAKTPLRISNSPGTVDCGYLDEIGIIITNTSFDNHVSRMNDCSLDTKDNKHGIYKIKKGDRIAQAVLKEVPKINFIQVENISQYNKNRGGGFGSTGVK